MGQFVNGDVVVLPFPFSDLSATKRRPALVLATLPGNDLIVCQITSQHVRDGLSIALEQNDFLTGQLSQPSNIRPNRIFTAEQSLVLYSIGRVKPEMLREVYETLHRLFSL